MSPYADGGAAPVDAMQLDEIRIHHLLRAVGVYLEEAYKGAEPPAVPAFPGPPDDSIRGALGLFTAECQGDGAAPRAYALRLGNRRYPFMKLRIEEHLIRGEYFFAVDTHDQMFCDKEDPELARLKAFNRELKDRIEAAWEGWGLPTVLHLKGLVEGMLLEREPRKGQRILLVDDCAAIQDTIALLLDSKGYDVDLASDGDEALEAADPERHALILMDVEMRRVWGDEACRELKACPRRKSIPVLLASAGAVDLARAAAPDGYLVKPFESAVLIRFLDTLLAKSRDGAATSSR